MTLAIVPGDLDDSRVRALLAHHVPLHIIEAPRDAGMRRSSLETGSADYFAAAWAPYRKHGFVVCEPFGDYALDPSSVDMRHAL